MTEAAVYWIEFGIIATTISVSLIGWMLWTGRLRFGIRRWGEDG
jgi:hypothetical protein